VALARYHRQNEMAEAIIPKRPVGLLLVDADILKSQIIPSPLRCLDVSKCHIQIHLLRLFFISSSGFFNDHLHLVHVSKPFGHFGNKKEKKCTSVA